MFLTIVPNNIHQIESKADFESRRCIELALQEKEKAIAEANLEAERIRKLAEARAEVISQQKEADAAVLREKALAFAQFGDAAKLEMVLAILPRLAGEVADPISKCDKITSVSNEDGSVGFSRVTDEVLGIVERLCQSVSTMTTQSIATGSSPYSAPGPVSPTASIASSVVETRSKFGATSRFGR